MTGALFCLMITQSIKRFEKVWNKDSFAVEHILIVCCRDMVALLSKRYWTFLPFFYVLTCITLLSGIYFLSTKVYISLTLLLRGLRSEAQTHTYFTSAKFRLDWFHLHKIIKKQCAIKVFQPAFKCAQHPKAGQNTQHLSLSCIIK